MHTDAHGKTAVHSRSDTYGKSGTRGTAKKSDGHKSRTNNNNKKEHENSDPEKGDHTGTVIVNKTYFIFFIKESRPH
jgi:hypothetical protein